MNNDSAYSDRMVQAGTGLPELLTLPLQNVALSELL
jgi:hypothetical protein